MRNQDDDADGNLGEDGLGFGGESGLGLAGLAGDGDRDGSKGVGVSAPRRLMLMPVWSWRDGEVGLDRVAFAVEASPFGLP